MPDKKIDGIKKVNREDVRKSRDVVLRSIDEEIRKRAIEIGITPEKNDKSMDGIFSPVGGNRQEKILEQQEREKDISKDRQVISEVDNKEKESIGASLLESRAIEHVASEELVKEVLQPQKKNVLTPAEKKILEAKKGQVLDALNLESVQVEIKSEEKPEEKKESDFVDDLNEKEKKESAPEIRVQHDDDLSLSKTAPEKTERRLFSDFLKDLALARQERQKERALKEEEKKQFKLVEKEEEKRIRLLAEEEKKKRHEQKKKKSLVKKKLIRTRLNYFGAQFWRSLREFVYFAGIIVFLNFVGYLLLVVIVLRFDLDHQMTRRISSHIPIPAFVTRGGVVEYYKYYDFRKELKKDHPGATLTELEKLVKIKIVEEIILDDLAKQYNIKRGGDFNRQIQEKISADSDKNAVAFSRMKKIKLMMNKKSDFIKTAIRYGDQTGSVVVDKDGQKFFSFGLAVANMQVGDISDIITTPEGYYIFRCIERNDDEVGLNYVFIKSMSFGDYIGEIAASYKLWSLVD